MFMILNSYINFSVYVYNLYTDKYYNIYSNSLTETSWYTYRSKSWDMLRMVSQLRGLAPFETMLLRIMFCSAPTSRLAI